MRHRAAFWLITVFAAFCLSVGVGIVLAGPSAQSGVSVLVNRDGVNIRLLPAIGAEVVGFVDAGFTAPANGRSGDGQWIRIDFLGQEGWIGVPVININGDVNSLTVSDPRSIPYGGFESPRAGLTSATSDIFGRLSNSGVRVRSGPGRGYVILANAPRYTIMPLLGRTGSNLWVQVNFEGTLGWVATTNMEFQNGASVLQLPIDGIVAESLPLSQDTQDDYLATLRLFQARLDLAQAPLDEIRAVWTSAALGTTPSCANFPARPSDYNIPNPLLAAFYPTLNPLQEDFNTAMANLRLAINLYIDACSQPGPFITSQPAVLGALDVLNTTTAQFGDVRARLTALLPPPRELGPNDCLFSYLGQFEILPVIPLNSIYRDNTFSVEKVAAGYCFDANAGDNIRVDVVRAQGTILPTLAVSQLDNPSNFLQVTRSFGGTDATTLGPIQITTSGRYLLIINDIDSRSREGVLSGDLAILITNLSVVGPILVLDPTTGIVTANLPNATAAPIGTIPPGSGGATVTPSSGIVCPSLSFTCDQLLNCSEAQACFAAGNFSLDGDGDGQPCSNLCGD